MLVGSCPDRLTEPRLQGYYTPLPAVQDCERAGASRPDEGHQVVPRQRARGKENHSLRDRQRRLDRGPFTRQRTDETRRRGKRGDVRGSREAREARDARVGDWEPCRQETYGEDGAREAGGKVEGQC